LSIKFACLIFHITPVYYPEIGNLFKFFNRCFLLLPECVNEGTRGRLAVDTGGRMAVDTGGRMAVDTRGCLTVDSSTWQAAYTGT